MDLYSRKIVGWHADHTMTKELVLKALQQAYVRQRPEGIPSCIILIEEVNMPQTIIKSNYNSME
jgi:transposase InsO family protein